MVVFSQCLDCKNYIGKNKDEKHSCNAFTKGIPDDVFWNKISHEENIHGDNGYKYEDVDD